ncbi:MAG TPA: hypothetical protein VME66_13520 [Candidatus Acidoferrales bacterium]|nr:hypothetical protein [Candidatus Acidoferrales bacterium]
MITGYRWRTDRALLVALILSLVLHFSGAALYGLLARQLVRLHLASPHPSPTEEVVSISSAITIDKRTHPVVVQHVTPRRPVVRVAQVPVQPTLPKVQIVVPRYKPPAVLKPELARPVPHSIPQGKPAPKSVQVALAPHEPQQTTRTTTGSAMLTPQQLAQLNQDFSQTISQAKSVNDPLKVPDQPQETEKRYRLQFAGATGGLGLCEGRWWPIKSWQEGGYDYYYASYDCVWPDGTYEDGGVPWPFRYPASRDPLVYPLESEIPLPGPPIGWTPPAGIRLGKAMRDILHMAQSTND